MADDRYWHFLGLKPGASAGEITAAHRRMAKMFHPDRGGTTEDMQRLQEAFEIVTGKRKANGGNGSTSSIDDLGNAIEIALLKQQMAGIAKKLADARRDIERLLRGILAVVGAWGGFSPLEPKFIEINVDLQDCDDVERILWGSLRDAMLELRSFGSRLVRSGPNSIN
jgi:hypothetical protein